ncbi:hypothetical protein ACIQXW_11355 [Lysinibacillus sp. NPDC097162]|uniref:hypothetical protein n=1 Tax=Lysinibacillus sp. NPDC097162 TaxID=3364140 RepID=UPI003822BA64
MKKNKKNKKNTKNTNIIILAVISSFILFGILLFWKDSNSVLNYFGISATIVGFILTLFLLNVVTDISKAFLAFKENQIFHDTVLQSFIKELEEIIAMADNLLSKEQVDELSIRAKFCSNIDITYSKYISDLSNYPVAGSGKFQEAFQRYENYIINKVKLNEEHKLTDELVIQSLKGNTQSILDSARLYESTLKSIN